MFQVIPIKQTSFLWLKWWIQLSLVRGFLMKKDNNDVESEQESDLMNNKKYFRLRTPD